jgi:hypothetical protein
MTRPLSFLRMRLVFVQDRVAHGAKAARLPADVKQAAYGGF